jgi:hypothetical protein
MTLQELTRRRDLLSLAVAVSAGAVLVLSIALALVATAPRPHLLVPAAGTPEVVKPGEVPDEAAKSFARLTVMTFDNYTPATIDAATAALKARIAARRWSEVADGLDRRAKVVAEGRMSSQAIATGVELARSGETITAVVRATRRLFIADKLSKESSVRYRLQLETCPPTAANPNGLAVAALHVEEEPDAKRP